MPKPKGENTKKVAGNAKKAASAQAKADEAAARQAAAEDQKWSDGAKSHAKKAEAEAKKREKDAKKAERDALLAEEAASLPSKPKVKSSGAVAKKGPVPAARGIDKALEESSGPPTATLSATGIDDALDALSLTKSANVKDIERHPERRFKAAITAYEEQRLPELRKENPGLRLNQMKELIRKEFEKSPLNPFNLVTVAHDATKEEKREVLEARRRGIESRLQG